MKTLILTIALLVAPLASGQVVYDSLTGTYQWGTYPYSRPLYNPYCSPYSYGAYGGYGAYGDYYSQRRLQRTLDNIEWNTQQIQQHQQLNSWRNW